MFRRCTWWIFQLLKYSKNERKLHKTVNFVDFPNTFELVLFQKGSNIFTTTLAAIQFWHLSIDLEHIILRK